MTGVRVSDGKGKPITVDDLVGDLESRGLYWTLDHLGDLIEARVLDGPHVVGRYRTKYMEPLVDMLFKAMMCVDWTKYPAPKSEPLFRSLPYVPDVGEFRRIDNFETALLEIAKGRTYEHRCDLDAVLAMQATARRALQWGA